MSSKNIPLKYIRVDDHNSLEIVEIQFEDILGVNKTDVNRIKWKSGTCPSMFNHSANPPHVDNMDTSGATPSKPQAPQ